MGVARHEWQRSPNGRDNGKMIDLFRRVRIDGATWVLGLIVATTLLAACSSPPKPSEPTGQWVPVNATTAQASGTR